jgi:uncharacterized alpha/beta hydrolase family protein
LAGPQIYFYRFADLEQEVDREETSKSLHEHALKKVIQSLQNRYQIPTLFPFIGFIKAA